jgi:hypothetical protein
MTPLVTYKDTLILPNSRDNLVIKSTSIRQILKILEPYPEPVEFEFVQSYTMVGVVNSIGKSFMDWQPMYDIIARNAKMQEENDTKWGDPAWVIARIVQKVGAYFIVDATEANLPEYSSSLEVHIVPVANTDYYMGITQLNASYLPKVHRNALEVATYEEFYRAFRGNFWLYNSAIEHWKSRGWVLSPVRQLKKETIEYIIDFVNKSFEKGGELYKQKLNTLLNSLEIE